jgi:hypothetical protein
MTRRSLESNRLPHAHVKRPSSSYSCSYVVSSSRMQRAPNLAAKRPDQTARARLKSISHIADLQRPARKPVHNSPASPAGKLWNCQRGGRSGNRGEGEWSRRRSTRLPPGRRDLASFTALRVKPSPAQAMALARKKPHAERCLFKCGNDGGSRGCRAAGCVARSLGASHTACISYPNEMIVPRVPERSAANHADRSRPVRDRPHHRVDGQVQQHKNGLRAAACFAAGASADGGERSDCVASGA